MISRYFIIKNFRNIGHNNKGAEIYTNFAYHLKNEEVHYKDKLSDGVNILIGENNIGKTNILNALQEFRDYDSYKLYNKEKEINKRDFPVFDDECDSYEISCVVQDGRKDNEESVSAKLTKHFKKDLSEPTRSLVFSDGFSINDFDWYQNFPRFLNDIYADAILVPKMQIFMDNIESCPYICSSYSKTKIDEIWKSYCVYKKMNPTKKQMTRNEFENEIYKFDKINKHNTGIWKDLLDCVNPSIIYFNQEIIGNFEMLLNSETNISKYSLFEKMPLNVPYCILNCLDINPDDELSFTSDASIDELSNRQAEINKKTSTLNEKFNSIFSINKLNDKFEFVFTYGQGFIKADLHKNGEYMDIANQSSAFQWFLGFYLYVVAYYKTSPHSIILLDEPCATLSLDSAREVKKIINDVSKTYNLTFLIATHSPSLVDVDCLEEVRVLESDGNNVDVKTFFNECKNKDIKDDMFKPILSALTAETNVLYNDVDNKVVFCEGISDYLYFSAYKEYFEKQGLNYDLIFIPLNGVSEGKTNDLEQRISKIQRPAILLTDAGEGDPGTSIRNSYNRKDINKRGPVAVFDLNDVSKDFGTIETLFSQNDQEMFDIDITIKDNDSKYWKKFIYSYGIKKAILDGKTDKTSVSNFRKVFDYFANGDLYVNSRFFSQGELKKFLNDGNSLEQKLKKPKIKK